jgi:hypothetical protein
LDLQIAIKITLYGDIRVKNEIINNNFGRLNTLNIDSEGIDIVNDILSKFDKIQEEVSYIFINGIYSGIHNEVKERERVGIFPKRIGIIFEEFKSPL